MEYCPCDKLSESTIKEIESIIGKRVVYLVAHDVEGGTTPLASPEVKVKKIDKFPIETKAIYSIQSAAFGSFAGSCCHFHKIGGENHPVFCFEWPGDCPGGLVQV